MSSETCNPTNSQHLFPTSIVTSAKMLKYPHIQPHPMAEDGKSRKDTRVQPYNPDQTHSVLRRNARERNRVKQVNNSFSRLRQHIPQTIIADLTKGGGRGPQKKISKVDTLRIAVEYIRRLQDLLDDLNGGATSNVGAAITTASLYQKSESQNNSDTASNSSFSSSNSSTSSLNTETTPLYFTQSTSPLPSLMDVSLQAGHLNPYSSSTTLLSPISLHSYSPQHNTQFDNKGCQSPTSSFNSSLSFESAKFEPQNLPDLSAHLSSHPQHQQQQHQQAISNQQQVQFGGNIQLKFEPYDNFNLDEEDCTPDDEEILDYISLWQEQ